MTAPAFFGRPAGEVEFVRGLGGRFSPAYSAATRSRTPTPGWALRFPLDADLAAALARLAAAEYRCCAFDSHRIVIDHTGLRLEVRMPTEAADQPAAVFGLADLPAEAAKEADGATHRS